MTIVSTRLLVSLLCLAFTAVLYLNLGLISGVECPAIGLGVSRQTAPTVNGTILSLNTTVVDQAPCDVRAQNDPVERRSKILQATMLFGINYAGKDGRNWKTWQSHVEHAKKWGYEDHLLERIMVGEGDWSGFIWSKTLHSLQLVLGELRKPLEQRAEWLM